MVHSVFNLSKKIANKKDTSEKGEREKAKKKKSRNVTCDILCSKLDIRSIYKETDGAPSGDDNFLQQPYGAAIAARILRSCYGIQLVY